MMDNKSVIVTGATSFIGNALIRQMLLEGGYRIFAVTSPDSNRKNSICKSDNVEIIESDLSGIDRILPDCTEKIDAIYHIGWSSRFDNARYNLDGQMQNVEYMQRVITLADRLGCKKVLGVGSQAECGRVGEPITELTPDHPETAYATAKCQTYERGMELCEKYGIRFFWPRLLSAYGPNDKMRTMIMSCLHAAVYKEKIQLTGCEQIWDYIYVDDAADALIRIVERGQCGVKYPIASGVGRKLVDYIAEIAEITNAPFLMDGIGMKPYAQEQVMYLVGNIRLLCEDTGFVRKTDFKQGIRNTINKNFR